MERISLSGDGVKYLVFEGGGGLGLVYLGAIDALEGMLGHQPRLSGSRHVQFPRRLFPINSEGPIESRPFRGVCGASAGAITAFMLAIGMDYYEIDEALAELHDVIFDPGDPKGSFEKWSAAENFFDAPNETANRVFRPDETGKQRSDYDWRNHEELLPVLKKWGRTLTIDILERLIFPSRTNYRKWPSIVMRLLLIGDMKSMKLRGAFGGGAPTMTDSRVSTQLFITHDNAATYLQSLLMGRGLFSGYAARKFFDDLIMSRLVAAHFTVYKGTVPLNPDLSFREFYNITGVDLVVTGVNISQRAPKYFSVWHTPDFPVVEAVVLSMSIPFAFKPTYIGGGVRQGDTAQNAAYKGLYVDGGMLNNYPVRAFDTIAKRSTLSTGDPILFQGKDVAEIGGVFLAVDPKEGTAGNEPFLGFRLVDMGDANVPYDQDQGPAPDTSFDSLFPASGNPRVGIDLLKDLYFTLMYPTSEGQIRYANDRSRTIPLNVHGLDVFDFAHPKADQRNNKIKSIIIDGKEKSELLGQWKNDRIKEAKLRIELRLTP